MPGFVINFDASTVPNAETLAAFLNEQPQRNDHEYCNVGAPDNDRIRDFRGQLQGADHVWLVGHGLADTRYIVDNSSNPVADILDVVDELYGMGVRYIIDSCCAPKTRALSVLYNQNQRNWDGLNYYCKTDPEAVSRGIGTARHGSVFDWYQDNAIGRFGVDQSAYPPRLPGKPP